MKAIYLVILLLGSKALYAHNPDLSTIVLSKIDDGRYVLQVVGSLTAFESEVNYVYGEDSYKTPDAFRQLLIEHFRKNFSFRMNEQELEFINPEVILGHETKLVTEVKGIPAQINSIELKNAVFSYMLNNQSVLMMIGAEFPNQKYVLNNDNSHQIQLKLANGNWASLKKAGDTQPVMNVYNVLWLLAIPAVYFSARLVKKKQQLNPA